MTEELRLQVDPDTTEEEREQDAVFERVAGALFSGAIADAMGWVTEFARSPDDLKRHFKTDKITDFVTWEKKTGGRFYTYYEYIQPGEYSDDTQLTLCTARSIKADGTFDAHYFAKTELPAWLDYARGAGATITGAAKAISRKAASWNGNFFTYNRRGRRYDYRDAGANGAAMRVSPIALANIRHPDRLSDEVFKAAIVTHGHPRAILGALVYARALNFLAASVKPTLEDFLTVLREFIEADHLRVLEDPDLQLWLQRWNLSTARPFHEVWADTRDEMKVKLSVALKSREQSASMRQILKELGCFEPSTRGSGTGTVAAALAIFMRHGKQLDKAVLEPVNQIGSDTDTIGAMAASLSGAYLGYTAIPERWASRMQDFNYFLRVSEALTRIALTRAQRNDLVLDRAHLTRAQGHDLLQVARDREVTSGMRVWHPVFGLGWVKHVDSKPVRRKGAGSMVQVRAAFDAGQSCVFKSYVGGPSLRTLQR